MSLSHVKYARVHWCRYLSAPCLLNPFLWENSKNGHQSIQKRVSCRILLPFQIYLPLSESTCMWDLHGCTVGFRYETLLPGCWYLWAPCLLNPFLWEEKKEALIILSKGETCSLLLIYLPLSIFTWIQYMSKMHVQLFLRDPFTPSHLLPSRNVRLHYFIHQQVCQGYISVQPLLYQLYCIFLTQL